MRLPSTLHLLRQNAKMTTKVYIYSPTDATGMREDVGRGEEGGLETAEEEEEEVK